jgi:hypothetical protein
MRKFTSPIIVFILLFLNQSVFAVTSNYKTFTDGAVLTAAELNNLQTNYTNGDNAILDGDNFTGDMKWYGGVDACFYSDSGTTKKACIDGATGEIIGAPVKAATYNIDLARATTSVAGDSIKIQCGGAACSATNPGFVVMNGTTAGALTQFTITSDVTINLTGAHWGAGTTGDLTGRILRVLAVNDNSTLRWCVALLGGRDTLLTTDTSATATDINLPEEVLCSAAVSSSTNTVLEVGYFRSDFDDTGGSSEDLNSIQSGVNDVVTGKNADGLWQPWNPAYTGFSAAPSGATARWVQSGRMVTIRYYASNGTSNATSFALTGPAKANTGINSTSLAEYVDNAILGTKGTGIVETTTGSQTLTLSIGSGSWNNSGSKYARFTFQYEVGPAASFIE